MSRNRKNSVTFDEEVVTIKDVNSGNDFSKLIDSFEKQRKDQKKIIEDLTESFNHMSKAFDDFKKEITVLRNDNKILKNDIGDLKGRVSVLEQKIQATERVNLSNKQNGNMNHMIITNMPQLSNDTDFKVVVNKMAKQMDYTLEPNEILDVYQIKNENRKSVSIVVKLSE